MLSVVAGGAIMAFFASTVTIICLIAWGLARMRRWWEERRGS